MSRPPKRPSTSSGSASLLGNDYAARNGISSHWLAYDRRNFGELLSDWQQTVSPGNVEGFLQSLYLDHAITPSQFVELVAGSAAPSRELVHYLAACAPDHIASWQVTCHRGHTAIAQANGNPIVSPSNTQILAARDRKLGDIASAAMRSPDNSYLGDWKDSVAKRLAEFAPDEPLDATATLANLARYLSIDAKVFEGTKTLTNDRAQAVASELAQLLKLQGDRFDRFIDDTVFALTSDHNTPPVNYRPFGAAVRFLRHASGLTQEQVAKRCPGVTHTAMKLIEQGFVPDSNHLEVLLGKIAATPAAAEVLHHLAVESPPFQTKVVASVVSHFSAAGLSEDAFVHAATKEPALFCQKPGTLISNVEGVVSHFISDGLTTRDYLRGD